jgi:hypothetical protein
MDESDTDRVIEFESAEEQLAQQRESERLGRNILTKSMAAGVCILILGIIIGGAGVHHFSTRVPPLSVVEYEEYGKILEHMPDAAMPACSDFQAYAGTLSMPAPAFELHGVARKFVDTALQLPRSHVGLRQVTTLDHAFKSGISVRGVWIRRAPRTDARLAAGDEAWPIEVGVDGGHRVGTKTLGLCSGGCNESIPFDVSDTEGCMIHLRHIVREMVGCSCCGDRSNCSATVVVHDFEAVCGKLPLTNADALSAAQTEDLRVQVEVSGYTETDLGLFAAILWPSMVTFPRASADAEVEARTVVASIFAAAKKLNATLPPKANAVVVGWPEMPNTRAHRLGPADMSSELPEHVSLGDLVVALRHDRAAAQFDFPTIFRTEPPFGSAVTFERGTVYVPPTLADLMPALSAYRMGAMAHAVASAVSPYLSCDGATSADTAAMLLAGSTVPTATSEDPILYALEDVVIGPPQLYYIGAAAAGSAEECRIGFVRDPQYAQAMGCPLAPCVGCGCH